MPSKFPLPLPTDDDREDPQKCPQKGAPAWMSTFADIAILLMAFFVLILSFAEFNQPRFKLVSGSLQQAFGIQRDVPVVEQPKGTTILELNFSPSPAIAMTEETKQDTTDTTRPEVVASDQSDGEGSGREGSAREEQEAGLPDPDEVVQQAARQLAEALQEALPSSEMRIEAAKGGVRVDFEDVAPEDVPDRLVELADALDAVSLDGSEVDALPAVQLQGLREELRSLATAALEEARETVEGESAARRAELAEAELRVALRQQIGQGLVTVEQTDDTVIVTVGAGGAFPSGDADLTDEARDIMARIAFAALGDAGDIQVTGHTDSVPLAPSSPFRDNWGLAAARASSVVRELQSTNGIDGARISALSRGESMPIADNGTAAGRERNRRIEIEFQY
ncbi:MAG: OmpA family protein [Pseudomonadota bacterium]